MPQIDVTKNFDFLQDNWNDYNIFVMEGSTRSGKTFAICQWIANLAINIPNYVIRVYRHDSTTHDKGAISDLDIVLGPTCMNLEKGNSGHYTKNSSTKVYTFWNGSTISFSATNDIQKLHGPSADISWFNEVMEISYAAYKQVANRNRDKIIMDFNPSYNQHWVFSAIQGRSEGVISNHSTFEDNPFLTDEQVAEIRRADPSDPENEKNGTADAYEWAVYGLGKRGQVKGAVFRRGEHWDVTDIWPKEEQWQRHGFGLDFGFQVDPTALTECCIFNRGLYLREHLYQTKYHVVKNITNPSLPSIQGHFEEMFMQKDTLICADQAAAESISSLRTHGYNILGVSKKKGKEGSILDGINLMKKFKIYVHRDSQNLQLEFEHYKWKEQTYKDGNTLMVKKPIDKDNHLIDAARYWTMYNLTGNLADYGSTVEINKQAFDNQRGGPRKVVNRARNRKIVGRS